MNFFERLGSIFFDYYNFDCFSILLILLYVMFTIIIARELFKRTRVIAHSTKLFKTMYFIILLIIVFTGFMYFANVYVYFCLLNYTITLIVAITITVSLLVFLLLEEIVTFTMNIYYYFKETNHYISIFKCVVISLSSLLFYYSGGNILTQPSFIIAVLCVSSVILVVLIKKLNCFRLINYYDSILIMAVLYFNIHSVFIMFQNIPSLNKYSMYFICAIFDLILIIRILDMRINHRKSISKVGYDLRELLESDSICNEEEKLPLVNAPVKYDLLNNDSSINNIVNQIITPNLNSPYIIGINGIKGSGRTTIINNIIKNLEIADEYHKYISINIDSYKYNEEAELLEDIYFKIFNKIGYINNSLNKKVFKKFYEQPGYLNSMFNKYIDKSEKHIILIIENIDDLGFNRLSFIMDKIINSFRFNNLIYILSYDREQLEKLYRVNNIECKNIFNYEFEIPLLNFEYYYNIYSKVFGNYKDKIQIYKIFEIWYPFIKTMKDFKFLINEIISSNYLNMEHFSLFDSISLELIKRHNIRLYKDIKQQKDIFIYNKERTDYTKEFDNFFQNKDYLLYINILEEMFPNVKLYRHLNSKIKNNLYEYRIFNVKYFDLYFMKKELVFLNMRNEVADLMYDFNEYKDFFVPNLIIRKYIKKVDISNQKIFADVLEEQLPKLYKYKNKLLVEILYDNLNVFYDIPDGRNARSKMTYIVAKLIAGLNKTEFENIEEMIRYDCPNIFNLQLIKKHLDQKNSLQAKEKQIIMDRIYTRVCRLIYDKDVDMYDSDNYHKYNMRTFYEFNDKMMRDYIKHRINSNNVYRFINDFVDVNAYNDGYLYSVDRKSINEIIDESLLDDLIEKSKDNLTKDQELVYKIYEHYRNNEIYYSDIYHIINV